MSQARQRKDDHQQDHTDGVETAIGRTALIALGSNLPSTSGPPASSIAQSIREIAVRIGTVTASSRLYSTPCFPPGAGPDYVNAAVRVQTDMAAPDLLAVLHAIEADFGRAREQRWGMRTLDLDLVALDDLVLPDAATHAQWRAMPADLQQMRAPDALILPHPRLQDRAFVLVPLADVAPDWRHPMLGLSVAEMLAARPPDERAAVVPLP